MENKIYEVVTELGVTLGHAKTETAAVRLGRKSMRETSMMGGCAVNFLVKLDGRIISKQVAVDNFGNRWVEA